MKIEIYFDDLSVDKQTELLEAYNIKDQKEMNWDTLPVAIIEKENNNE
jgi:hypothetical protein